MKLIITTIALCFSLFWQSGIFANECPSVLKHVKRKLNSQETINLCEAYSGKAVLFVNTASKCGFTPQFESLEALSKNYAEKDLVVLGFPSFSFAQEYSDESKTAELCELTYGVEFPMFETISVKGDDADPLYLQLERITGQAPKWNFNKYLMSKNGEKIVHFDSRVSPSDKQLLLAIEKAIDNTL